MKKIKIICFDIDNVICKTNSNHDYKKSKPKKKVIKFINELFSLGYIIKIYTARYMGRNNEDYLNVKKKYFETTKQQLNGWGLNYHKLYMGKPNFDLFVDDKALNFTNEWPKQLKKKLNIKNKNL